MVGAVRPDTPHQVALRFTLLRPSRCQPLERPQATEPRSGANQQVKGHVRVCAPFKHAADRGQQGTVGGLEPGPWDLAAQDTELVAQHQEFQVLGGIAAGQECEQLDRAAQREVGEP